MMTLYNTVSGLCCLYILTNVIKGTCIMCLICNIIYSVYIERYINYMYVNFINNMAFKEGGSHLLIDKTSIVF